MLRNSMPRRRSSSWRYDSSLTVRTSNQLLLSDAKFEREPVGEIHEILVLDHSAGDIGAQPIVAAGEVGPRIVNVISHGPGGCAARREIAIPQGAHGFADTLLRRIETLKHQ